jgi:uncharacterized phiE125 gp8 family phage protein
MEVREKSGQILTEPVTTAEFKTFSGYSGTDQDSLIASLITAARQFLELETGVSCLSKVYEVQFNRWDMISDDLSHVGYSGYDDGWFRLPFAPVTSITSAKINDVAVTYDERGQGVIEIRPDTVVQTGTSSNELDVVFTAGETSTMAKNAILRIVSDLFNNREDDISGVSMARLSFDTQRFINNLSKNTGF